MNKKNLLLLVFLSLAFTPVINATEYLSPRTLGLGGAGRAAPILNDSLYLNPSYASFTPSYNLSTGYTWFDKGRNYNASIQDSRTEMFQAGIGFTRREQNAAINFGASKQAIQNLGLGLGAKVIIDDQTNKMTTDSVFSTSFIASTDFYSSLIIDNLFESNNGKSRNLYRTLYLGTKYILISGIQFYFDPFYSPSYPFGKKAGYAAGAEFAILTDCFLRVGRFVSSDISYLNTHSTGYGVGFGWVGPRLTLDYALHKVTAVDVGTTKGTSHSVSMTVFF